MASPWRWNEDARRYIDTRTGRFISQQAMMGLRDTFATAMGGEARKATQALIDAGTPDGLVKWMQDMREIVKTATIDEYILGRGGRWQMTPSDWGRTGQMIREQYQYIQRFAGDILDGKLTPAQMLARAQMYGQCGTEAYEKGNAQAMGGLNLPAYPGDGSSECLVYCRCHWDIQDKTSHWEATWVLGPVEKHCPTCYGRSHDWAPLMIGR